MILADIEAVLKEIDPIVYYGAVDRSMRETVWNYIVFNRTKIKRSANKTSASDCFDVHIIRENYIPEGLEEEIIEKLCALPGVRLAMEDINFVQDRKPNTNSVVEILTISFVRARKS